MDNQEIINSTTDDDIDLNEIVSSIYRNKKLVLAFIISGIFLTSLIAFTTKKTWQGGFQIVIGQSKSMPENLAVNPSLLQLAGRSIVANKLETEVGILESPYLLMNIFKFVKKEKNNNKLRFSSWKESNLEIKLKDKTSILNVNYKDNEKSLIIPVLEKISKAYQEYSTEKQELSIKDSSKFLKKTN
ncbi:Wzz/FepE/Etk N-terminal domain-containing protein [Prochlorococcus sp. MIT 1011]|uniref:Wzz/FepE/Etk N-terminal domain-containing protein n=1 Tax=Prochlorococcus sp. MIT 1011 TaxID=3082520 RepID=UPI0039B572A0